jgi:hypothetical protein
MLAKSNGGQRAATVTETNQLWYKAHSFQSHSLW